MTFFARPNLSDLQFKQEIDSSLSLSGITKIRNWSGLTITDGIGGDVIITASGASAINTEGHVLTYMDGLISLKPSSTSGGTFQFDTHRETTREGVPPITVGGECTVNNFIEGYFFPAVAPSSALSIVGNVLSREFGDSYHGQLCYEALKNSNEICLIALSWQGENVYACPYVTTIPISGDCSGIYTCSYTYPATCSIPATGTSITSVSYSVCVEDVTALASVSSKTITWRNNKFIMKSSTLYTDDSIVGALTGGVLSSSILLDLSKENFSNEFFYYVYPSSFGEPSFIVNNLPNNGWGNISNNTLFKFNYTNPNGYINQYYVARSDNRITGEFNINIT